MALPAIVLTSRYLQTNATVLLGMAAGTLVVDSPYFPDELQQLAARAREGDGRILLFATHAHHDHLMGRLALPRAPLLAAADTAAEVRRDPGRAARDLAREDARTYVRRAASLEVGDIEPVDRIEDLVLVPATGHTGDGCALHWPDGGVLCCGDYLSDVEIPLLSWAGSLPAYRATLDRLEPLLRRSRLVVPGHGSPTTGDGARRRLEADRAYLDGLHAADPNQPLPSGRDSDRQREIHLANLERHA